MPADWQLPTGVARGLWNTFNDPALACGYDAALAGTPLCSLDLEFVRALCRPPGRFLDLGCGTGRLALTLAQQGYRPVAVDLSPAMLKVLGEKAAALGVEIPRVCANLVALECLTDQSFDHAACLFGTLGLIEGATNRQRFLEHVARLLRPGGVFVLHVHNLWSHFGTRHGRRLLCRNLFGACVGKNRLGDFMMPPHRGQGAIPMHLFTRRGIVRALKKAGFTVSVVQPVGSSQDGRLRSPWFLGRLRAYGYLIAGEVRRGS